MPQRSPIFSVFVSSTSEDLKDYRKAAESVILDLQWRPLMMEHFVAQPEPTVEACYNAIDQSDVVLLIVAWRQGWVPSKEQGGNGQNSVTALEYAHSLSKNVPILVLLASDLWPIGKGDYDDPTKLQWIRRFRENLDRVAGFFKYEEGTDLPQFRTLVKQTLLAHKERMLATQVRDAPALDFFGSAREGLFEGTNIPVLGCGVYGDGPLGSCGLARALLKPNGDAPAEVPGEKLSLATAAEYRERLEVTRSQFLKRFQRILEQQAKEAVTSPLVNLIVGIERVRLVVSTTYDLLLENKLRDAGRKYVVVCHVLRSFENQENGKVILFRPNSKPELCCANELRVDADDCIVYKPLGSPFLHEAIDPELEIDTVVVTETDHACFLPRLESPETGVPGVIMKRFLRDPLLFLGYTLDVWQYRLAMLIFQASRRQNRITLAVRIPDGVIEEAAWNKLNAQLIRVDPSQFAKPAAAIGTAS